MTVLSLRHYPFVFARQHQLQFDAGQFDERAVGLGGAEAAIEIGNEVLLEIVIGRAVIGSAVMAEFLRQPSLDGAKGARCGRAPAVNGPGSGGCPTCGGLCSPRRSALRPLRPLVHFGRSDCHDRYRVHPA